MEAPDSTSILVQCREDTDKQESVWSRAPPVCGKLLKAWADLEEVGGAGQGVWTPLKNHKSIGFLSNTGQDPLTLTKLPIQNSMLCHHQHASETHFNGVSLVGR